ncbi:MAG: hypothetical protein Tsb002_06300 [Wenzhouxiangellaceae bacterium]
MLLLAVIANNGWSHPYHESLAELEWNQASGRWEVALRVLPEDLEDAVSAFTGRRSVIDATPGMDQAVAAYLQHRFQIRTVGGEQLSTLHWVGKQVDHKAAWLYFELEAPAPPVELRNTVLFERQPQQINRVLLWVQGQRQAVDFSAARGGDWQLIGQQVDSAEPPADGS